MAYATLKFVPSPFLIFLHKSLIPSFKPVISIVNDILFVTMFSPFQIYNRFRSRCSKNTNTTWSLKIYQQWHTIIFGDKPVQ